MDDTTESATIRHYCRSIKIILGSLFLGVALFATIVLTVLRPAPGADEASVVGYGAIVFAGLAVLFAAILPGVIAGTAVSAIRRGKLPPTLGQQVPRGTSSTDPVAILCTAYQFRTIVGGAILEGAAFFNLIAYMFEGWWVNLAVAAVLALGILLQWPSVARIQSWVRTQQENMQLP